MPTICLAAPCWQLFELWYKKCLFYFVRSASVEQWDTLFDKVSEDIQDRGIGLRWHLVYQVVRQLILQELLADRV